MRFLVQMLVEQRFLYVFDGFWVMGLGTIRDIGDTKDTACNNIQAIFYR